MPHCGHLPLSPPLKHTTVYKFPHNSVHLSLHPNPTHLQNSKEVSASLLVQSMAIRWSSSSSTEDANNWDLHAVVRGCSSTATSTGLDPFGSYPVDHFFVNEEFVGGGGGGDGSSFLPDPATTGNVPHELGELCKPFLSKSQQLPQERVIADLQQTQEEPHQRVSKRRKNQQKKVVCQVPADGLSSDMWAWRKYGQKPIKGSPYPRGYYRCSSSKGCLARKQVERSRTDPTMLIITYTAEHNHPIPTHRNSLAGSTRNEFTPLPSRDCEQNLTSNNKPASRPLLTLPMTGLSPTTPLTTPMEDELLMPKGDVEEENDGDEEEEGIEPIAEKMTKEDMVFMDSEKLGDDIDIEDFVNKFFSNVWQIEGNATEGDLHR